MKGQLTQLLIATLFAGSALSACGTISTVNPYFFKEATILQSQLATGVWSGTTFTEYASLGRWNETGIGEIEADDKSHKVNMALEPVNVTTTVSATGKQIAPAVQAILDNCGPSNTLDNAWEWVNTQHTMKVYISAEY